MTNLLSFTTPETLAAMIALTERRKPTSGGPRDRAKHLAYQKRYEATRRHGVKLPSGHVLTYETRKSADRVRGAVRAMAHVAMPVELFCELAHVAFRSATSDVSEILMAFSRQQAAMAQALTLQKAA